VEAAEAALAASGAAIRPNFRAGLLADDKSDESPVTIADRGAEEILRKSLQAAFPDFGIIGEEFPAYRPEQKYVWVIDPIDGTRAFITGRPSFCTLLGLLEDGVPVLGLIDQPVTRERWCGGRGGIGWFKGEYGRFGTRQTISLAGAELSSTAPEALPPPYKERFAKLQGATKRIYWGGDAYGYGLLALGQVDVVAETGLKTWDWAALAPVVQAAGGVITDWQGRPLKLGVTEGDVLASANPDLHRAALAALA